MINRLDDPEGGFKVKKVQCDKLKVILKVKKLKTGRKILTWKLEIHAKK